ncbi:Alpha/beta-Hydrolases superfamily protein isoform 2 [Hibiscus syriacus]|uniref:Alpha/beta-Hydrolases superfamily protein isoform 2 n=1 Tax=Hibiscus syriacus TaxID=106335 RepID=A0A6A2YJ31_HIBSY|nr:Alpha/beta-Hydrolases superfamily protein isoform 2 [Hibiscus syriacus]
MGTNGSRQERSGLGEKTSDLDENSIGIRIAIPQRVDSRMTWDLRRTSGDSTQRLNRIGYAIDLIGYGYSDKPSPGEPWFGRPFIASFQSLLRNTAVGKAFFRSVATPESVRSILCQIILHPGLEPGAVDVFLEFICYSGGPLPEELLPQVKDPWESIELGRAYGNFDTVEDFVVLPNVGHCPQDEAPHLVNPLVESFVARHSKSPARASATI